MLKGQARPRLKKPKSTEGRMTMRKLGCSLFALMLLVSLTSANQWVSLTPYHHPLSVQVLENTENRIVLDYNINGFHQDEITIGGEVYAQISLADEGYLWERACPDLPRLDRSVIVPDQARMSARIIASDYRDIPNVKIAPSKGHLLRSVNPDDVPFEFGAIYQRDAWYPAEIVTLRDPYILRDLRGQVVEVNAFQYNPVRQILRVYTYLEVEVVPNGVGGENVLDRSQPLTKMDPTFRRLYQRHFLNFDPDRYTPVEEVGPMLVITYDAFFGTAMPLVDWKNQKGIPTSIVNVSTIGNNATAIKNYIRALYESTGLTFVLIVGDHAQVASPISSGGTDPTYALLVGSDHYPELFVGRFSAETVAQAFTQVERTVEYEKMPQTGATWYAEGTGIASAQGAGIGHYGEADFVHMNYIRHDLLEYGYSSVDQIYDPGATSSQVTAALNEGRSILNYCGHGSTTSWGTTGFNNGNVNALVNDNKLHFGTTVACLCGNFTGTTCFAEAWLRATHDGEPTGAIGFYTSSISQSWAPPMYAQDEFVDLLVADVFHAYGALCFNGAMLMIDETGSTGNNEFDHWHVFGDPSLQVRTAAPSTLTASHASSVNYGQTTFNVTVPGTANALVALSAAGVMIGNDYTDASGQAVLTLNWTPLGSAALVTVTSYNATPYIAEIPIVGGGAPAVDIALTPIGAPIQIPGSGGSFDFTAALANMAGSTYIFDAWIMQQIPDLTWQGPMLGPVSLMMANGATLAKTRTQNVPGTAVPGTYTYRGYVGDYASVNWDSSSFTYEKLTTGDGQFVGNWDNFGDSFESPMTAGLVALPEAIALIGNYPNPFNPSTAISFQLSANSHVSLRIYDTAGRLVSDLVNGWREAGSHEATFDGGNLASGVYVYRLNAGQFSATGKMLLLK
jgi:hypothetical protein